MNENNNNNKKLDNEFGLTFRIEANALIYFIFLVVRSSRILSVYIYIYIYIHQGIQILLIHQYE